MKWLERREGKWAIALSLRWRNNVLRAPTDGRPTTEPNAKCRNSGTCLALASRIYLLPLFLVLIGIGKSAHFVFSLQ